MITIPDLLRPVHRAGGGVGVEAAVRLESGRLRRPRRHLRRPHRRPPPPPQGDDAAGMVDFDC